MRGQDFSRLTRLSVVIVASATPAMLFTLAASYPQESPRLTGEKSPMEDAAAPPLARWIADDVRRMRSYPEQPPVIPHAIEGYQLSLNANRCLECHRREFTEGSGAPMISVTHFMDREGQMLANVSPRRYFCLQCHVPQTEVKPLVPNLFRDMAESGPDEIPAVSP